MKGKYCIFLLFILVALISCNDPKPVTDTLHRAEALMNEYPDSAWTLLNTISPDEMEQNRNRALYALLYTQAQDKTYRDETNDSLISVAVDYYRNTDNVRHKFLSYYYKGRVMMNAGESIKAMLSFLEAESLCEDVNDGYLLGLLYTQMGDIYKNYYDYPRSLEMFQKATACYEQAGKDLHYLYALVDQANVYKNMGKNEDSYQQLWVVLNDGKQNGFHKLVELCLGDLVMLCVKLKKYAEADKLLQELQLHYDSSSMSSSFWADVAEIHAMKKEWNLSQEKLDLAWKRARTENDTIVLYFAEARIHGMRYPQTESYRFMMQAVKKQNGLVRRSMEQPLLSVQNNLLATELEFQQYKLRIERIQRWTIVLFVVVVSTGIIYVLQKWMRKRYQKWVLERLRKQEACHQLDLQCLQKELAKKDENIRALIEEFNQKTDAKDLNYRRVLANLESELASKEKLYGEYVQRVEIMQNDKEGCMVKLNQLFNERIKLADEILRVQITDFATDKLKQDALRTFIDSFIKKVVKSKNSYELLEEWVNMSNQNVMKHLRSEVELPDEDSYRQVCYHIAGYSVYAISSLMCETKNKIYKRRDRIRKKIEELAPESMDLFSRCLCK